MSRICTKLLFVCNRAHVGETYFHLEKTPVQHFNNLITPYRTYEMT